MIDDSRKQTVLARLKLAKRVFEENEQVRSRDDLLIVNDGGWTHGYRDPDAIVNYLLLTCFDILGPKDSQWLSFNDWLVSGRTRERRDEIARGVEGLDAVKATIELHRGYLDGYGTKQGFHRFIDEVLSPTLRETLLHSVKACDIGSNEVFDETAKRKFLFGLRNAFTHEGKSCGSNARAMVPTIILIDKAGLKWGYEPIWNDGKLSYVVRRWPFILFETLFGALNEPVDDDYDIAINVLVSLSDGRMKLRRARLVSRTSTLVVSAIQARGGGVLLLAECAH